jgi:hypothetical protein
VERRFGAGSARVRGVPDAGAPPITVTIAVSARGRVTLDGALVFVERSDLCGRWLSGRVLDARRRRLGLVAGAVAPRRRGVDPEGERTPTTDGPGSGFLPISLSTS